MPLNARLGAAKLLSEFDLKSINASDLLNRYFDQVDNRGMLTDLVYGTIRNLNLLDLILNQTSNVVAQRCKPFIINLLRTGIYQIIFCGDKPDYAVVNETVRFGRGERERGFINAVLRNVIRSIDSFVELSGVSSLGGNILAIRPGWGLKFKDSLLAEPQTKPGAWLSQVFSLPRLLVDEWVKEYGFDKTLDMCFGLNRRPSVYLRVNRLRTDVESFCGLLDENKVKYSVVEGHSSFIKVEMPGRIDNLPGYSEGFFSVQDITAGSVAQMLEPAACDVVADLCAAPGTKAAHLAELMGGRGMVIAADINADRAKRIEETKVRLGLDNIEVMGFDDVFNKIAGLKPNKILLDVPCSNTGVMARRTELRPRFDSTATGGPV